MTFKKSVHNALWGSESWEISAHPSDPSVIVGGGREGETLREVFPNFPLLFKVIDAKTRLSVQVHPNEETCKVTGEIANYTSLMELIAAVPPELFAKGLRVYGASGPACVV